MGPLTKPAGTCERGASQVRSPAAALWCRPQCLGGGSAARKRVAPDASEQGPCVLCVLWRAGGPGRAAHPQLRVRGGLWRLRLLLAVPQPDAPAARRAAGGGAAAHLAALLGAGERLGAPLRHSPAGFLRAASGLAMFPPLFVRWRRKSWRAVQGVVASDACGGGGARGVQVPAGPSPRLLVELSQPPGSGAYLDPVLVVMAAQAVRGGGQVVRVSAGGLRAGCEGRLSAPALRTAREGRLSAGGLRAAREGRLSAGGLRAACEGRLCGAGELPPRVAQVGCHSACGRAGVTATGLPVTAPAGCSAAQRRSGVGCRRRGKRSRRSRAVRVRACCAPAQQDLPTLADVTYQDPDEYQDVRTSYAELVITTPPG